MERAPLVPNPVATVGKASVRSTRGLMAPLQQGQESLPISAAMGTQGCHPKSCLFQGKGNQGPEPAYYPKHAVNQVLGHKGGVYKTETVGLEGRRED